MDSTPFMAFGCVANWLQPAASGTFDAPAISRDHTDHNVLVANTPNLLTISTDSKNLPK